MLTPQQLASLKADILADPALAALPNTADNAFAIAAIYNTVFSPSFWVWRTFVTKAEIVQNQSVDGTSFSWVGNGFITRAVGERDAWREIFNGTDACNPSLINVRQAFIDIFSGTGTAAANRQHLVATFRRQATRLEKLFATGDGTTGTPATMTVEEPISYQDVLQARELP